MKALAQQNKGKAQLSVTEPGKKLTSYGVQHGSEIVIEAREGKAVETRQGKQSTGRRREIKKTKGRQAI